MTTRAQVLFADQRVTATPLNRDPVIGLLLVAGSLLGLGLVQHFHLTALVAVIAPVGLVVVYLAVRRPVVALVALQVAAWSGASSIVGTHSGFSVYTGSLVVGLISLVLAVRRDHIQPFGRSPIYLLVALVAFAQGLSLLLSPYPLTSLTTPVSSLKDVTFFIVTLGLLRAIKGYRTIAIVIVVTIVALAALTVVQQYALHNATDLAGFSNVPVGADIGSATARHSGPEGDVNFWGRTIVLTTGICLALAMIDRHRRRRRFVLWLVAATVLAAGEYLTSSRGGLIAFAVLFLAWLLVALWRRPKYLLLVPVAFALMAVAVPGLSSRLSTLGELTGSAQGSTDPSLLGRLQAQEVGMAMFRDHPEFGVGDGNFIPVEPQFLGTPGVVQTGSILAPHDLYLELAAEQGVTGVAAWLLFFGGSLVLALRASAVARRAGMGELGDLSVGVALSLAGWAVASVFLHLADFNDLLAVVAMAAGLDMEARSAASGLSWEERIKRRRVTVSTRDRLALVARLSAPVVVALVVVGAVMAAIPLRRTEYQSTATAAVSPAAAPPSGENAYTWETLGGGAVVPTFARIAAAPRFVAEAEHRPQSALLRNVTVSGRGDVPSAVMEVTATAPSATTARTTATAVMSHARQYLQSVAPLYKVSAVESVAVKPLPILRAGVAVLDGGLVLLAVGFVWFRQRRTIDKRRVRLPRT